MTEGHDAAAANPGQRGGRLPGRSPRGMMPGDSRADTVGAMTDTTKTNGGLQVRSGADAWQTTPADSRTPAS